MGKHLPKLSWQDDESRRGGGRWYVRSEDTGKRKYFSAGKGQSDREAKRQAQEKAADWLQAQIELTFKPDPQQRKLYEYAIAKREQILEFMQLSGKVDEPLKSRITEELAQLKKQAKLKNPPPLKSTKKFAPSPSPIKADPLSHLDEFENRMWQSRVTSVKRYHEWSDSPVIAPETIEKHGRDFLKVKERAAKIGEIEPSTYKTIYERLEHFLDWAGRKHVSELERTLLARWKGELEDRVIGESKEVEKTISTRYASNLLKIAKTFANYLYEQEVIDRLPRAWKSLSISVTDPEVVVFTIAEVKRLLDHATPRTKLFVLLMLNCGYYPADIADIKCKEVDWERGRIRRKRKKTRKRQTVPVVDHVLWDETFELLKEFGSQVGPYVITNMNGNTMVRRGFNEKKAGKVGYTNNIALAWKYLQVDQLELSKDERKQMQSLRKTSTDLLTNSKDHAAVAQHFAGQAPRLLIDSRYKVSPDKDELDEVIVWLGEQFGLTTKRKIGH